LDRCDSDVRNVRNTRAYRQNKASSRGVLLRCAFGISRRESRADHSALSSAAAPAAIPCAVDYRPNATPPIGRNCVHLSALGQLRLGDLCRRTWGPSFERTCLSDAEVVAKCGIEAEGVTGSATCVSFRRTPRIARRFRLDREHTTQRRNDMVDKMPNKTRPFCHQQYSEIVAVA
jgi:hypothetical protein